MEVLYNGFTLDFCDGAFPLGTDSVALADFVKLPKNARVLDLGSGCGTLGLFLCAKDSGCTVTGVEIREADHRMALENALRNGLTSRLYSICGDACCIPEEIAPGSIQVCVSNPPYYTGGPKSKKSPDARRDDLLPMASLFSSAAKSLCYGGDFYLVHRPERLAQICALASQNRLEPKHLRLLRHTSRGNISLILVQCRKGGKPGLVLDEAALYTADGAPTSYYQRLYHI